MAPNDVAVITQPLIDARGSVLGHEMRLGGPIDPSADGAAATGALLLGVFGALELDGRAADAPAWLPIEHEFLLEFDLPPVRPDRVVLQVRDIPSDGPLPDALARLERTGYTLALDGFDGRRGGALAACTWVRIDAGGRSPSDLGVLLDAARAEGVRAVAVGLEQRGAHERVRHLGFDAFQGAAVAEPRVLHRRLPPICSEHSLEGLAQLAAGDQVADLDHLVASDPGIALTLLHYVADAYAAEPALASVREALALLGPRMVHRWASMLAPAALDPACEDVGARALRRAQACEAASGAVAPDERASYFTVGLLSVAEELTGAPLADTLDALPLAPDVRTALLARAGPKGDRLATVLRYEEPAPV